MSILSGSIFLQDSPNCKCSLFVRSAGCVLLLTGLAKLVSAFGTAAILNIADPIFHMQFKHIFILAGLIELIVGGICLVRPRRSWSLLLLAWVTTCFVLYRIGLPLSGWHRPCPCLGYFTESLHLSQQFADWCMKGVLMYLLLGSYYALFTSRRRV
jgi:hypothetical protein